MLILKKDSKNVKLSQNAKKITKTRKKKMKSQLFAIEGHTSHWKLHIYIALSLNSAAFSLSNSAAITTI